MDHGHGVYIIHLFASINLHIRGVDPLPKLGVFKCDIITWRQKMTSPALNKID